MKSPLIPGTLIMLLSWMPAGTASGQDPADPGASAACGGIPLELYRMPRQQLQTRWYTFENQQGVKGGGGKAKFGRKGSPATWIKPGDSFEMLNVDGPGTIRRIWITTHPYKPETLRAVKIAMYWDGASTPAVQGPIGDFFCHSLGHMVPFQNACFSSPEGRSYNSVVPMPF
jgi:hypothetical protein